MEVLGQNGCHWAYAVLSSTPTFFGFWGSERETAFHLQETGARRLRWSEMHRTPGCTEGILGREKGLGCHMGDNYKTAFTNIS